MPLFNFGGDPAQPQHSTQLVNANQAGFSGSTPLVSLTQQTSSQGAFASPLAPDSGLTAPQSLVQPVQNPVQSVQALTDQVQTPTDPVQTVDLGNNNTIPSQMSNLPTPPDPMSTSEGVKEPVLAAVQTPMTTLVTEQIQSELLPQPGIVPQPSIQPQSDIPTQPASEIPTQPNIVPQHSGQLQPDMQPYIQPQPEVVPQPVNQTQSSATLADMPPIVDTDPTMTQSQAINQTAQNQEKESLVTSTTENNSEQRGEEKAAADTAIEKIMKIAEERGASDIHFAANYPVMIRVHGELHDVTPPISVEQSKTLAMSLLSPERQKQYTEEKEVDFSYTNAKDTRFRVNLFTEKGNPAGALRLIAKNIKTIKELELPDIIYQLLEEPHGLILVVGPTGSGKSTTLAAMINHINLEKKKHIITVEDPIEYIYPVAKSIIDQREIGADSLSWKKALKSILREDPNVVLVGEMRDLDTIEATITIAETGHLTFATLHTNSASQAIDRIIDVFPEGAKAQIRAQLANVITAVISQRLVPIKGGGRKAVLEVMLGTVAIKNTIREGKTYQIDNMIQTSGDLGMITLEKSLVEQVNKGYITKDEAKAYSVKPDEIDSLLAKLG